MADEALRSLLAAPRDGEPMMAEADRVRMAADRSLPTGATSERAAAPTCGLESDLPLGRGSAVATLARSKTEAGHRCQLITPIAAGPRLVIFFFSLRCYETKNKRKADMA